MFVSEVYFSRENLALLAGIKVELLTTTEPLLICRCREDKNGSLRHVSRPAALIFHQTQLWPSRFSPVDRLQLLFCFRSRCRLSHRCQRVIVRTAQFGTKPPKGCLLLFPAVQQTAGLVKCKRRLAPLRQQYAGDISTQILLCSVWCREVTSLTGIQIG